MPKGWTRRNGEQRGWKDGRRDVMMCMWHDLVSVGCWVLGESEDRDRSEAQLMMLDECLRVFSGLLRVHDMITHVS